MLFQILLQLANDLRVKETPESFGTGQKVPRRISVPALQPPDIENAARAVTVCVALGKGDFSVHHNRAVPVTGAAIEVRNLASVIGLMDTKPAALIINVE